MSFWDKLRDNFLHPIRDFVFDPANVGTAAGFLVGGPAGAAAGRTLGNAADRLGEKYLDTGTGFREADPITLGSTAKNAATGYALGTAANLVAPSVGVRPGSFSEFLGFGEGAAGGAGGAGGAGAVLPDPTVAMQNSVTSVAPPVTPGGPAMLPPAPASPAASPAAAPMTAAPAPVVADAGGGGFTGRVSNFWDGLSGMEKLYAGSQLFGAGTDLYGAYQMGQEQDRLREEEEERRRARSELFRAFIQDPDRFGL